MSSDEAHLCHFLLHLDVVGRWRDHIVGWFSHLGVSSFELWYLRKLRLTVFAHSIGVASWKLRTVLMAVHGLADGIEPRRQTAWRILFCAHAQLFHLRIRSFSRTVIDTGAFSASRILVTNRKAQGR